MSHAAQCLFCQHARRDTSKPLTRATIGKTRLPLPVGCDRFNDGTDQPAALTDLREVVAMLLYDKAGSSRCALFKRIELQPDAYFAQDAPRKGAP